MVVAGGGDREDPTCYRSHNNKGKYSKKDGLPYKHMSVSRTGSNHHNDRPKDDRQQQNYNHHKKDDSPCRGRDHEKEKDAR